MRHHPAQIREPREGRFLNVGFGEGGHIWDASQEFVVQYL